jgi:chaperonin GroES
MKFHPLHDRVVIKIVAEETRTRGGIIIPETAQEKPMEAEIIAVGTGGRDERGQVVPLHLKPDDRVLFGKWTATDGVSYLIMKETDIMGVIETAAASKAA